MNAPLTVSNTAKTKLNELVQAQGIETLQIRIFVLGRGCSGMGFGFVIEESERKDDFIDKSTDAQILMDPISFQYLKGSTLTYNEELTGSGFNIDTAIGTTTCGCSSQVD